ncbi:DeoR/GlpR family DNA-binding transcription regulator [Tritonibacter horizontis]|uniref:Glycerol-3-phosphate regulon repressor n=1 Tax=Tritonibacter horizontis TaxID=1768241 RepID=A0A132BQ60_9RHOB|nr:DeoR/GlpR family DNA-binding transcription regulator [Tritonibacter horizontis]KUP90543.1 glycerol-3-phosphate regulon repressor [Tritonibacter horizontis]
MSAEKLNHRGVELLQALERFGGSARSADLAEALDVSGETVRRTIAGLAEAGHVQRVHGGVLLSGQDTGGSDFVARMGQRAREKRAIARRIATEITDGMTVFLDVSTTTSFVAECLTRRSGLTIVTNGVSVGQALSDRNRTSLHLLGGEMSNRDNGTFGTLTETQAARFAYDLAIFGVDAISVSQGYLYHSPPEAALAGVVARGAARIVVGATGEKLHSTAPHKGLLPGQVDMLVCDSTLPPDLATALAAAGTRLVVVDPAPEPQPAT